MDIRTIKKTAYIVNSVILAMVFGLMAFFDMCKATFLTYFSIPTALVYVIGYFLIAKNKLSGYVMMVYMWLTFYMGITTLFLGYDYGFHLYCFSMIPVAFVTDYMAYRLGKAERRALVISIGVAVFYLICTGYVAVNGAVYNSDRRLTVVFWMSNSVTVLAFLLFYSWYLIRSIINSEEKLKEIAHKDRLTGLYNRHYMIDYLETAERAGSVGSLVMADIDDFKKINDAYGHNAGDAVLMEVSRKLSDICAGSVTARWGGEEFLIYLPVNADEGESLLEKVREKIAADRVRFEDKEIRVTVTLGLVERVQGKSIDLWIQDVDKKLYIGKNSGKNRVVR